jgi:hypothetical protein
VAPPQLAAQHCCLDKLRPRANNGDDIHTMAIVVVGALTGRRGIACNAPTAYTLMCSE